MCSISADWLKSFARACASFGPAAFSVHFAGFRYDCSCDSLAYTLCGVVRFRDGLVSRRQTRCPAMSLSSLGTKGSVFFTLNQAEKKELKGKKNLKNSFTLQTITKGVETLCYWVLFRHLFPPPPPPPLNEIRNEIAPALKGGGGGGLEVYYIVHWPFRV